MRDVARFARLVVEQGLEGSFNLAGPRLTWAAFLELLGATQLVWVPAALIADAGLTFHELPLFRPTGGPRSSLMDVSSERAQASGLALADPADTARDVRAWLQGRPFVPALPREREAELISLARQHAGRGVGSRPRGAEDGAGQL